MAVAIGKGARLIEGIQSDQTSPAHVELGDGNAVIVELYASGLNPVAQFQLLDSAEPSVGYRAVLDPAGLQTALTPNTVNKYLVPNVLPFVRIRVTPTSGSWSARVTPVLATQPSATTVAPGQPAVPVNPQLGPPLFPAGAANLAINTDTPYTFASQVHHVVVQNNTATAATVAFDAAATAGSYSVPAGSERSFDLACTVLHLFSAAASAVNGTAAANIVVMGAV